MFEKHTRAFKIQTPALPQKKIYRLSSLNKYIPTHRKIDFFKKNIHAHRYKKKKYL